MVRSTLRGELTQLFHLYLAWVHRRAGRLERARARLDKALLAIPKSEPFVEAFDASLMVREDRLGEAKARFANCLERVENAECADDLYVRKYCELYGAIWDEDADFDEIRSVAEALNDAGREASKTVQSFLPRTSSETLKEICGHRKSAGNQTVGVEFSF